MASWPSGARSCLRMDEEYFVTKLRWIIACLLWFGSGAHALLLTPTMEQASLLNYATFLEDPGGRLTLEEVRAKDRDFRPWLLGGSKLNFGFTASAYWIKLPLKRLPAAPQRWLLEIDYAKLQKIDFYPPRGPAILTGSERPFQSKPYFDRFFIFPLELGIEEESYYLRVTSKYSLTLPLRLWQPDAYIAVQQGFHALQFIYFGSLVVLAIYGLIIFIAIRYKLFALYGAYILATGIAMLASNGYGRLFFWPDSPNFDEISQTLFFSLTAFFATWFARGFVSDDSAPRLSLMLKSCQFLFVLIAGLTLLQPLLPALVFVANQLLLINSVTMGLLVTVAGYQAYVQKRRGVRFFLIGWIILWAGVCVAALRAFGWVPTNGFTSYAVQITTAIEMLMVAVALGDLLREEHLARLQAQKNMLTSKQALLEMSQAAEEKLKQAVQERTEQLQMALRQEKYLRDQYVRIGSMISHEFRTPLSIILNQSSLMRKEYTKGIDQVLKRLEAIAGATGRLKLMFDKWLQSDSLNETLQSLEIKSFSLRGWVQNLLQNHAHLLLNHTVNVQLPVQVDTVLADDYHLDIALSNLLDNAAKYSPANSTVIISTRTKSGFVGIAVTDQGPGIPEEVQGKIFSDFFRVAPESHIRGMGLGLSIVQRIVDAHRGHMELTSAPGKGSTFCVWLPTGTSTASM